MWKLLFFCTLIILNGCTVPVNKIKDGGFLSQEPCGPPCLYDVTPGITTQAQAMELSQKRDGIFNSCKYIDLTSSGGKSGISCDHIDMVFQNSLVRGVKYIPSVSITSKQVIETYRSPDRVRYLYYFPSRQTFSSRNGILL